MKKTLLVMALVSTASYATYRYVSGGSSATVAHDDSLVQDRLWIDHLPKNDRDTAQVFAAFTEQPVGVFQAVSQWEGAHQIFLYEMHGTEMRLHFPQNGDKEKVTAKARPCSEGQMDYCLELAGSSRGVKKYYSRKGWELDGVHSAGQLDDRAEQLVKSLIPTEK